MRLSKQTRRRSPPSLSVAPPTEGAPPKTHKEHCKRRTSILPRAPCKRHTVCFVLPAGNCTITTQTGKRGSGGFNDTCDTVHGHQQLSLFNAHYDERCFLPIHIYDAASGK